MRNGTWLRPIRLIWKHRRWGDAWSLVVLLAFAFGAITKLAEGDYFAAAGDAISAIVVPGTLLSIAYARARFLDELADLEQQDAELEAAAADVARALRAGFWLPE